MEVLVFGGSGFMGRRLVELLSCTPGVNVTLCNRGKPHWGDANPCGVAAVRCERSDDVAVAAALRSKSWTAIVDFTSFDAEDVAPVCSVFGGVEDRDRLPHYVLVSTDNVYNCCSHFGETVQIEANTNDVPSDEAERLRLAEEDEYGAGKLVVEQALGRVFGDRLLVLRLPDVIGPFDDDRVWRLFLWLSVSSRFPLYSMPGGSGGPFKLVFADDVARLILAVVTAPPRGRLAGVFNVANDEVYTFGQLATAFAAAAGFEPVVWASAIPDELHELHIPSVDYCIDTSKLAAAAAAEVRWTPLAFGLQATARFYLRAWDKYPREREKCLANLPAAWVGPIRQRMAALCCDT